MRERGPGDSIFYEGPRGHPHQETVTRDEQGWEPWTTTHLWLQHHLAVEMPTVTLRKFTEQSGRKSHNKENQNNCLWRMNSLALRRKWFHFFFFLYLDIKALLDVIAKKNNKKKNKQTCRSFKQSGLKTFLYRECYQCMQQSSWECGFCCLTGLF